MGYRELIKKIQQISGFSDSESKQALDLMVKGLAERLTEEEREDFASELPPELQEIALSAEPASATQKNIIEEFMEIERIDEARAKKQVLSTWDAIKEAISPGEIADMRAQFSKQTAALLYP